MRPPGDAIQHGSRMQRCALGVFHSGAVHAHACHPLTCSRMPVRSYLNDLVEVDTRRGEWHGVHPGAHPLLLCTPLFHCLRSCCAALSSCLLTGLIMTLINTPAPSSRAHCAGSVRSVPTVGALPEARAYHRFVSVPGSCHCYVICGRSHGNRLCKGKQMIQIYDCNSNRWITPGGVGAWLLGGTHTQGEVPCWDSLPWRNFAIRNWIQPITRSASPLCCIAAGVISGDLSPRSSLAAAAIDGGIVVFGGATDRGERSDELSLLSVAHNKLQWRPCPRTADALWPMPRGAHTAEVVSGRIYCAGGYGSVRGSGACLIVGTCCCGVH